METFNPDAREETNKGEIKDEQNKAENLSDQENIERDSVIPNEMEDQQYTNVQSTPEMQHPEDKKVNQTTKMVHPSRDEYMILNNGKRTKEAPIPKPRTGKSFEFSGGTPEKDAREEKNKEEIKGKLDTFKEGRAPLHAKQMVKSKENEDSDYEDMSSAEREHSTRTKISSCASHHGKQSAENEVEGAAASNSNAATEKSTRDTDSPYENIPQNPQTSSNAMSDTVREPSKDSSYIPKQEVKYQEEKVSRRYRHEKKPRKSVDDIKNIREMLEVFDLLHIEHDPEELSLKEMKKTAKKVIEDQSSGSGKYLNGTTGFEVITKAKDEDKLKRKKLEEFYSDVEECVKKLDEDAIEVLDVYYGDRGVLNVLAEQKERLTNTEYNVLIAGESSAGKSSLLNLILDEELLAHHVLNTTSTMCELKFAKEPKLVGHYEYDKEQKKRPLPTKIPLKTEKECRQSVHDQIAPYVKTEADERQKGPKYTRVEIFWPHELLEKGIAIIDSPGLGESDEMNKVLMNYLPYAFAFIYVLDVSHAGGMQKDIKEKLMDIVKKVHSSSGSVETLQHLAESSLFICNKWDLVKEAERSDTKKHVVAKLSECWEDSNLNHQIVYMSITDAIKAQEYGGVTEEFNELLQKIKTMILKAINIRLYNHWLWLYVAMHHIYRLTYFINQQTQSSHQETFERMEAIERRMETIEKQEQDVRENMKARLEDQTTVLHAKLEAYINSTDFERNFCTWTNSPFPQYGKTWEITKDNVNKAIDSRFKELLIQWENDHQVYSEIHKQLLHEFRTRLNLLEEELQGIDKAMHSVERQADYAKNRKKFSTTTKVIFGATSPLWIPFGVAGLVIGMPVLGAMAVKRRVDERNKLEDYKQNPCDYLEKRSRKYLKRLPKEHVLEYAQRQMENTKNVLSKYGDQIPILIEAGTKLVKHLSNETRTQDEVLRLYAPIEKKSVEMINKITPLGIELCPETVNANDLEWKEEIKSCLGEGEFSVVYKGKLKNAGGAKSQISEINVAVKVFKHPFDDLNTRFFLDEEVQIRDLEHKNVLKYFGAARVSTPHARNKYKFIFVMKACQENLRNVIFENPIFAPAQSENSKLAIGKFKKWAMEIADGLNYIHEQGLTHRHLKLENILEDEDGTVMISDIGIVGQHLETERSITYLAPEVFEDQMNRTKEADIYSYGIMLWEMWYGKQAFTELMPIEIVEFRKELADGHRPKTGFTTISIPAIHAVMVKCWATKVEERYSAKECGRLFQDMIEG